MDDPYAVLGLDRRASTAEIKSAYRALAKVWHPDRHRGDAVARERFVEINEAYQFLVQSDRRTLRFTGSGGFGRRRAKADTAAKRPPVEPKPQAAEEPEPTDDEMMERIFGISPAARQSVDDAPGIDEIPQDTTPDAADEPEQAGTKNTNHGRTVLLALNVLFGRRNRSRNEEGEPAGTAAVLHACANVALATVLTGGTVDAVLDDGRSTPVSIAKGIGDGSVISLTKEETGFEGPVELTVRYEQTDAFWCAGHDVHTSLAIDLETAVLGGRKTLQTLDGSIRLTIPPWSGSDRTLKVSARGLPKDGDSRGDFFVHLRVLLPEATDPRIIDLMKERKEGFYV